MLSQEDHDLYKKSRLMTYRAMFEGIRGSPARSHYRPTPWT